MLWDFDVTRKKGERGRESKTDWLASIKCVLQTAIEKAQNISCTLETAVTYFI